MAAVLGIDAAWTARNPSGVALALQIGSSWRLIRASASYADFLNEVAGARPMGGPAAVPALLDRARILAGGEPVLVVAVDMPLSFEKIVSRRVSDNAVSRAFRGDEVRHPADEHAAVPPDRIRAERAWTEGWKAANRPSPLERII